MKQFFGCLLLLAVLCPALHAQINWQPTNGPEGGANGIVCENAQYAFYSTIKNLYRTADGINWERVGDGDLYPIKTGANKIAGLQGGISNRGNNYKFVVSYDNGNTWLEGTLPPTQYIPFQSMAVCSHGIYVMDGSQSLLFRSQDDGLTWDTVAAPGQYGYDLFTFEDRLYAQYSQKYWRLSDSGVDWEVITPASGMQELLNGLLVSGVNIFVSTQKSFLSSNDNGVTWHIKNIPNNYATRNFMRIGDRVYRLGNYGKTLYYTDDFGVSWNEVYLPLDYIIYDFSTAGGRLLANTANKGVLYFDETANQLMSANKGINIASVYDLEASSNELWAACSNGAFAYDLATQQWVEKALLPQPLSQYKQVAISPSGKIAIVDSYDSQGRFCYVSSDNGATWDTINVPYDNPGLWLIEIGQLTWLDDVMVITAAHSNSNMALRSLDFGQNWEVTPKYNWITAFNGQYFGLNGGGLAVTSDLGQTWQNVQGLNYPIQMLYTSGDRLFALHYVNQDQSTVLYSSADGINWTYSNDGLPVLNQWHEVVNNIYSGHIWHRNDRYYLYDIDAGFFTSLDTCKTWLPVYYSDGKDVTIADTLLYTGSVGEGVSKSALPQNYGSISSGTVFKDDNNNGLREANEMLLRYAQVNVTEPNGWYPFWFATTDTAGHYSIGSLPAGGDTLRAQIQASYVENINPPHYIVNSNGNDRNFGIHFTPDITDLSVTGSLCGRPRIGYDLDIHVNYANVGTLPATGTISVKLDANYHYVGATPAPSAVFGDSLVWNISQLALFEYRRILINGHIPSTATLGSPFKIKGYMMSSVADFNLSNNVFTASDKIVSAYDPNEKRVEPSAGLTPIEIAAGKELLYTIHFQNTGTYQADRVRITDHLDTALNFKTLRLVASSHNVTGFQLLPGGLLEVVFDHIALPDSNANEAASHGFVTFAIQRNKAFNANPYNVIRNKAAIYFDFNEPIITNTVNSGLILTPVGTNDPSAQIAKNENLLIVPTPNDEHFTVTTQPTLSGPGLLTIYDATGQICFQQSLYDLSQPIQVNAPMLVTGLYFVQISGKAGVLTGKTIVQH